MSISLDTIVDVTVEVNNPSIITSDFNLGLIIGDSTVLTDVKRVKQYSRSAYQKQMVADGFTTSSPEYMGVVAYFSQTPTPSNVAVGVKLASETFAQAVINCRAFDNTWYSVSFCIPTTDTDMPGVASAVEAFNVPTVFFFQSADPKCIQVGTANVLKNIQDAGYNRTCGFYYLTQYFVNGVTGLFCGMNSMAPGSAYTMAYKNIVGFSSLDLSDSELFALVSCNGNTYCKFGRRHNFVYPGLMGSGRHMDEQFMIDAIYFLIQENTVSGLASTRVIPQTESGVTDIVSYVTGGCEELRRMGFVSPGIWTGSPVLNLNTGDAVPGGYLVQAGTLAEQSASDRASRKSPPIYVALKASGAIEHVTVRVFVNQ